MDTFIASILFDFGMVMLIVVSMFIRHWDNVRANRRMIPEELQRGAELYRELPKYEAEKKDEFVQWLRSTKTSYFYAFTHPFSELKWYGRSVGPGGYLFEVHLSYEFIVQTIREFLRIRLFLLREISNVYIINRDGGIESIIAKFLLQRIAWVSKEELHELEPLTT